MLYSGIEPKDIKKYWNCQSVYAVDEDRNELQRVSAEQRSREWCKRNTKQQEDVYPQNSKVNSDNVAEHILMTYPQYAQENKTNNVSKQVGNETINVRLQRRWSIRSSYSRHY